MNVSDYNQNAQKAVSQGMETFLNWQKQALENTLTMVEEGIAVQEKNLNETRKQYQDWEQNINRELNSQKEQYKSMVLKISESYFPESKNQIDQAESFTRKTSVVWWRKPARWLEAASSATSKPRLPLRKSG